MAGPFPTVSVAVAAEIRQRYAEGASIRALAPEYGISYRTAYRYLTETHDVRGMVEPRVRAWLDRYGSDLEPWQGDIIVRKVLATAQRELEAALGVTENARSRGLARRTGHDNSPAFGGASCGVTRSYATPHSTIRRVR